jgi:hypothetical protein
MGNLRASLIGLTALAACSSNSGGKQTDGPPIKIIDAPTPDSPKVFMDAPPTNFDFSCMGNTQPAADATVTVAGTVEEVGLMGTTPMITPLVGATMVACTGNCNGANKLDANPPTTTMTSGTGGTYSTKALTTGGTPLDAYITMTKSGDRATMVYPPAPLAKTPPVVPMFTFTAEAWVAVVLLLQGGQMNANGNIILFLTDCSNVPLNDPTNVTVSVQQNGQDVAGDKIVDASSLNAMLGGAYVVFNVPPGATTVNATWKGHQMRAHVVNVAATTSTETIIRPGF